jgi:nitrate reductase beta subunit
MGVSCQRHAPAALYPREWTAGTHYTGGWVGPKVSLDKEAGGKILCRESNLDRPVVQPVARHYTNWATLAPGDTAAELKTLDSP